MEVRGRQVNISARFGPGGGGQCLIGMVGGGGVHMIAREYCVILTPSSTGTSYPRQ